MKNIYKNMLFPDETKYLFGCIIEIIRLSTIMESLLSIMILIEIIIRLTGTTCVFRNGWIRPYRNPGEYSTKYLIIGFCSIFLMVKCINYLLEGYSMNASIYNNILSIISPYWRITSLQKSDSWYKSIYPF